MSNYTNLKNAIQSVIKANGNNEITGSNLQEELLSMITVLGAGYQYMGVAQPSTNPGTPDARVMYLAYMPGIYTNFGGIEVTGFCVLRYDTSWIKEDIPISGGGGGGTDFLTEPDDLTLVPSGDTSILKFADRNYNSAIPNGLGYKILRGNNTMASQVTASNTIYEIRYDFDLGGNTLIMPSGCILFFMGGSIKNGVLNLSGDCGIFGKSGIKCEISNPPAVETRLSTYLADASNSQRNQSVMQAMLDAGVPIVVDINVDVASPLSVKTRAVVTGLSGNETITFPTTKGFVWNQQGADSYSNRFERLTLLSSDNTFDFVNGGNAARPNNVYLSTFNELKVTSVNGHCFYAGDNFGANQDTCCFDNQFTAIYVTAQSGCGFYGLSGNTHRFVKCRCGRCGEAVFYNCSGFFDSFNGAWGTNTPTFYKARKKSNGTAIQLFCEFINCNVESFQSILFDCYDISAYCHFIIKGCSFYVTPNSGGTIDYFPMYFYSLQDLDYSNNVVNVYNNGSYDSSHAFWMIARFQDCRYSIDAEAKVYYLIGSSSYTTNMIAITSSMEYEVKLTGGTNSYKNIRKLAAATLKADTIIRSFKEVSITATSSGYVAVTGADWREGYKFKHSASLDVAGANHTISYIGNPDIRSDALFRQFPGSNEFFVLNGNTNMTITFSPGSTQQGGFSTPDGMSVVLAPGEMAKFTMYYASNICKYKVTPYSVTRRAAASSRPSTGLYIGVMFYDLVLNKPIWYRGSGEWIDATGAVV